MSELFTEPKATTPDGQEPTSPAQPTSYVGQIVAEKGEQWNDPEALAKGYVNAQARIKELEAIAEAAKQNDYAKELLDQLQAKQTPEPTGGDVAPVQGTETQSNTSPDPDEIKRLVEESILSNKTKEAQAANVAKVDKVLVDKFGTDAQNKVRAKAAELGMTLERMGQIAGESPDAFLTLIGEAPPKQTNSVPNSTVNSEVLTTQSGVRDSRYYTELFRKDRKRYMSPEVQNQMMMDAMELGAKFHS